jgi:hypothetical protein
MPCFVSEDDERQIQINTNRKAFGIAATNYQLYLEVACQACRRLEECDRIDRAPELVKKWWADHKKRDEDREKNQALAVKQQEEDERETLVRLLKKHPDVLKKR